MAINIKEILSPQALVDYTKAFPVMDEGLGKLFPTRKIDAMEADMILGARNLPVSAEFYAFDTPTKIGQREGYESGKLGFGFIKHKMKLDEEEIINLSRPRDSAEVRYIINNIYNDVEKVRQRIEVRIERMRYEALLTGKLVVENENGFSTTVDFGMPSNHKGTHNWSNPDTDVFEELFKIKQKIREDTGFSPTHLMVNEKWLYTLLKNNTVKLAINGDNNKSKYITPAQLNDNLRAMDLPYITTNNRQYAVEKIVKGKRTTKFVNYLPEDKFVVMPDGKLGDTFRGTTPERESDRINNIATVDAGETTLTYYAEVDPVAHYVKGSTTAMVSFPYADQVYVGTLT